MARAERLLELGDLLRRRGATTIGEIARELGISARTVFRDVASLRARGLPILGDPGPGGGVRIDPAHRAPVHFTIEEIVGIWLTARLARETSDLPWSQAATNGLSKLLTHLPAGRAEAMRRLCRRVIVGPPASEKTRGGAGGPPRELLHIFEDAFSNGQTLKFDYINKNGERSRRTVQPHGLLVQPPVWYILSWDVEHREPRTFRMDRIARPRIFRTTTFRPDLEIVRVQVPKTDRWRPLLGSL
jgi:predicted DNA-binding transcriptional regulator YafY